MQTHGARRHPGIYTALFYILFLVVQLGEKNVLVHAIAAYSSLTRNTHTTRADAWCFLARGTYIEKAKFSGRVDLLYGHSRSTCGGEGKSLLIKLHAPPRHCVRDAPVARQRTTTTTGMCVAHFRWRRRRRCAERHQGLSIAANSSACCLVRVWKEVVYVTQCFSLSWWCSYVPGSILL